MAKELKIFISDQELNLYDAARTKFSASYSIADIKDLDVNKRNSSLTKTITVPASANNKNILGFPEDPNSQLALDQTTKPDARAEIDGTSILNGTIKITEAIRDGKDKVVEYKLVLYGDNGDWKLKIKDLNLRDLDFSSNDHTYDKATIDTSETIDPSRMYVYPLINYGKFSGGQSVNTEVRIKDRFPAFNAKAMVDEVFRVAGYKIISTFFDSDFFGRLYLPFTEKMLSHDEAFVTPQLFRAGLSADFTPTIPFFNNGNRWLQIRSNNNVFAEAKINTSLTLDSGSIQFQSGDVITTWIKHVSQSGTFTEQVPLDVDSSNGFFDNGGNFNTSSNQYVMPETAIHRFIFTVNEIDGNDDIVAASVSFHNLVSKQILPGETIQVNANLPDMLQVDLIKGLKHCFHLYFDTDVEAREVRIEPRDDFFTTVAINWSDKIDVSDKIRLRYLGDRLNQEMEFRYMEDSNDKQVEKINDSRDVDLAAQRIDLLNKFAKEGRGKLENDVFAPTLMDTERLIGMFNSPLPKMWQEYSSLIPPPQSTDFESRLLYYAGVTSNRGSDVWTFEGQTRTDWPEMYSVNDLVDNDNNLYFNDGLRSNGLFEKHYRNQIEEVDSGRMRIARFNLNDADIANLDFAVPIYISTGAEGSTYRLNKVKNYSPFIRKLTEVELIKIVNLKAIADITTIAENEDEAPTKDFPPEDDIIQTFSDPDGNMIMNRQQNRSLAENALVLGQGLTASKAYQTVIGNYNEQDDDAQMIIGGGQPGNFKNLMKVDSGGNLIGTGQQLYMALDGITHPVYYVDGDGNTQLMKL